MPYADLHTHTTYSDGRLTPAVLMAKAQQRGMRALAVTDHDTIGGWAATKEAARSRNIHVVSGVELSVTVDDREVHLLGYGFDPSHPGLRAHLEAFEAARRERVREMVARLDTLGLSLTVEEVTPGSSGHRALGRPHVARALVQRGYVASYEEAFERYLSRDRPAFVEKPEVPATQVLDLLHEADGVGVLAHPGHWTGGFLLSELVRAGLDGIEVVHPSHDEVLEQYYERVAQDYGLLRTGGSDYHGQRPEEEQHFGRCGLSRDGWMAFKQAIT